MNISLSPEANKTSTHQNSIRELKKEKAKPSLICLKGHHANEGDRNGGKTLVQGTGREQAGSRELSWVRTQVGRLAAPEGQHGTTPE